MNIQKLQIPEVSISTEGAAEGSVLQIINQVASWGVGVVTHAAAVAATTTVLPAGTYNNGAGTFTVTAHGALPAIDGITLVLTNRVLVKNQASALQNGIYTVTTVGDAGTSAVLTRATDMDAGSEAQSGATIYVNSGTVNGGHAFQLVGQDPIVIGTTPINFTMMSSAALTNAHIYVGSAANVATDVAVSGDLTLINTGAFTIANSAVTLAKMANIADQTILGNNSGGSAAPIALTAAQTKVVLSLNNVENTALSTWAGSANLTTLGTIVTGVWSATAIADNKIASALTGKTYNALTLTALATGFTIAGGTTSKTLTVPLDATVSGTNTGDQTITLTGDVTGSGTSSFAATIANNAVTFAKMNNISTAQILGRATAGSGNIESLSASSARTVLGLGVADSVTFGTVSATTFTGAVVGNASTATALQTARTINGVSFDGTANIVVTAAAGTLTGATLAANVLASSLTSVGTLAALTVTATIVGSVNGNAATATLAAAATILATARAINGVNFDGSAPITVAAAAGTLTGATLAANVLASSLTSVGTLSALTVTGNLNNTALTASVAVFTDASKNLVSNAITGTGNVVMSASPTLTGTIGAAAMTLSSTLLVSGVATFTLQPIMSSLAASLPVFTDGSKGLVNNTMTGTGNVVMSASPTLTGTIAAASQTLSGNLALSGSASTMAIGVGAQPDTALYVSEFTTGLTGTTQYGILARTKFSSGATTAGIDLGCQVRTAAAAFTMVTGKAIDIVDANVGAGSAITTLIGLNINDMTAGGTNYAIKTGLGLVDLGGELKLSSSNTVNASVLATVTNKIAIKINGTQYYLLASTSNA